MDNKGFENFKKRFRLLAEKNNHLVVNTLSNIFTMRLIGNKTHGDLAEIGMAEFINQFMYDYKSTHVGKDLYRAKEHEEDIVITDEINSNSFPVSLKAYGNGYLQLSTDKDQRLFPYLQEMGTDITNKAVIEKIFDSVAFAEFGNIHVMPLIYDETRQRCNIMPFDYEKAKADTVRIVYIGRNQRYDKALRKVIVGKGRSHPIFMFLNEQGEYIFEVRYGGASANALQRGLWTHTIHAAQYFDSLTGGWIEYSHNLTLVRLFSLALNSSEYGHKEANKILQQDIEHLKTRL